VGGEQDRILAIPKLVLLEVPSRNPVRGHLLGSSGKTEESCKDEKETNPTANGHRPF